MQKSRLLCFASFLRFLAVSHPLSNPGVFVFSLSSSAAAKRFRPPPVEMGTVHRFVLFFFFFKPSGFFWVDEISR